MQAHHRYMAVTTSCHSGLLIRLISLIQSMQPLSVRMNSLHTRILICSTFRRPVYAFSQSMALGDDQIWQRLYLREPYSPGNQSACSITARCGVTLLI